MDSDQGKLFIGGISWETSEERLTDYFKAYGDVVETVVMKDRATGRARGFGFVVFADPAVADRVLLEKHTIDGRVVEAKKAVPREEQQNFSRSNSTNPMSGGQIRTKKIFVGGLASTVTEEDFKSYFEQFGNITDVVVMYDHNTQRHRGFGFITFDTEDAVDKVLQKPFHELREKMVEVKRAIPKELSAGNVGRPATMGFGAGGGRGTPFGGYGQGYSHSPGSGYGPRVDNRYASASAGRGTYPSYGHGGYAPGGFVSGGYGTGGGGYGPAMNGSYGPSGYTSGAGYAAPAGYGGAPTGTGFGTPAATGYGTVSVGPRSPWGGGASSGFASGGSPAGYGASAGGAMGGYGSTGWVSGGATQPTGSASYGSVPPVYGTGETGYGSTAPGYGARGGVPVGPTGYGDAYTGSAYGDSAWRPGGSDSHTSGSAPGATVTYGMGGGVPVEAPTNEPANYTGGYGVTGRQTQRGPDTRFRPYPAANERTA